MSSSEPLCSTRRDDGLWESIETDDFEALDGTQPSGDAPTPEDGLGISCIISKKEETLRPNMTSAGTQTPLQALPTQTMLTSPRKLNELDLGPTTVHTSNLAPRVLSFTLPQPGLTTSVDAVIGTPVVASSSTRRRRGRPRKATAFRDRRSLRFSDPGPPEHEPELSSRDSHVFVRLLKVVAEFESPSAGPAAKRRHEFSWNNRGKGWRVAGRRSDEGLVKILSLFQSPPIAGVKLCLVVLPTERGGVQQPVGMVWDEGRACFLGNNQDGKSLSVTLGEMRDMARDPWARQFVGYIVN